MATETKRKSIAELNQEYWESKNNNQVNSEGSASSKASIKDLNRQYNISKILGNPTSQEEFDERAKTLTDTINTRMQSFTEQYNSFFNDYHDSNAVYNASKQLKREAEILNGMLSEYGALFDDNYVSETSNWLNNIDDDLSKGAEMWSSFPSEKVYGFYTKYQGMTPEEEAKALEDLNLRYATASTAGSEEAKLLQEEIDYLYNYGSKETQIAGRKKQYANNSAEIKNLNAEMKPLEEQAIALFNEIEHTLDLDKVAELQKKRNDILASYNDLKAQRDALAAENTRYERGEGVTDKVYAEYKYVTEKPDYAEYSKAGESKIGGFLGLGGDDKYDYINDINGLRIQRSANAMRGGGGNPYKIYDHMTEDEIGVYNYLYATEGKDSANDYLKKLESALDVRSTDANTELQQKLVKENPWYAAVMNIGSVITKPFGDAAALVDNTINQIQGEDINPYSQWQTMRNTNNAVREATTQIIEANTDWEFLDQNVWGQVYNAGMSTLDSLYGVAMFGNGYSFIASSGAAANKAAELYEKGATSDQIFWGGTAAGLAEFVFEKVSIDNLIKAKNPDSVFKVITEVLKQAGIEGSEEIATEIANTITDTVIMGSQSDLSLAVKAYQDEGLSYEEAYKKALQDKATDVIWAGISGMLSGGVSGGITTTHQGISNAVAGKGIKKQGDTEAMIMAGVDAQQGSQAYGLAEKAFRDYTEGDALYRFAEKAAGADSKFTKWVAKGHGKGNVSSMRLGALKQTTMEDVVDQYRNRETLSKNDIQAKLESRGIDSKKAAEFASVVAKVANGKKLSERESAILNDNIDVKDVAEEVSSGQVVDNIAANIKLNKIDSLGKEKVAETPDTYSVSEADGKTLLKDSGAEVNIVDIVSIDNGNMMLKVNDGTEVKEVNAENISFASTEEAVMYEMVAGMDIDAASAKAIIGNFDAKSGITAGQYILGAQEAFTYGKYNFAPEEMSKIGFSADLTQAQKTFAYNLGKNMHITNVDAQESAVKKAVEEAKKGDKAQGSKKGNVIYESGETDLTDRQEASVKSLEVIAKALGINIYLYESTLDDKGRRAYTNEKGERITANGYYDPKTGDIHIDINAGENGEGVMLFTAAHELTHFVRQWSPAKFKALADFLMAEYGKAGVPVAELVRYQQNLASKQGRKISYDTAYEEMIADSMQTMLSDGAVVEKLAKLANKDKSLVEKMKELMDGLVEKIKSVYSEMTPYSKAGRYASMLNEAERLQGLFYDALVSAGENYRGAGGKMNTADAEMKLMARELGDDLGTVERTDNDDIALITNKDNSLLLYSARTYEDGGREKLEATLKANGHTQEEINDTLKLVDDAADYLRILAAGYAKRNYGKFGERLSEHLEATVTTDLKGHKQVLSTLVNNGDYPVNLDLALICKKRVAYMRLMTRLIEDGVFGDVVYGGDAIAEVNAILREDGFETACLGCFVESRRLQFQTWAETIVQEWNEAVDAHTKNAGYFGFAKGGKGNLTEADMDAMEAELKGQKKNDKGNVNLGQGSAVTRMNRLLDKMPSLAKKLTVDDLLTPQGLTTLRQADGNLFSIVKSRYGAASPKIVQEFSPYASEIANLTFNYVKKMTGESISGGKGYIGDAQKELAAEKPVKAKGESKEDFKARKKVWDDKVETLAMNNYLFAIGGARIQSFSDFMIENVFDYIQIMADLAAKGSPLHGYTKEIACLRLFGMTGAKWNGSLIAHVDRSMGKEMAGLLPASEAKNGNAILVHTPKGDYAIGFDDYARHIATNKKSFIQSIGMKDIAALMLDPRYSANVGNITIGVSDMQILAMLDSPLFRMVIPYHASGMLPQFAQLVGVDNYNDYTDYQNTTVKQYFDLEGNPIKELKKANGKDLLKPDMSYKYNEKVQELAKKGVKDAPRQAANDYIEWCGKMHPVYDGKKRVGYATLKPKFSDSPYGTDFSKHKNYYKLLEDFNMYDNNTEAVALQEAVKMVLPSEANRLSAEQMEAYKQALRDTGIFTEAEISKYAKKADMTFEEIIKAEMDNRQAYEEETDPKWDTTVKKVEDHLKKHHPRNGQAKSAEDYKIAKGDSAISRIKAVDGSYAIQIAPNEMKLSERVTDQETLDFLENQEHITTYKSFQLIDGKLYSPMAAKVKGDDGKYHLTNPSEIGVWQQAVEDTKNIKFNDKGIGYYVLNKGNGKSITAAYNPYEHSSNLVLNDQFEEAYQRPNLVTVECIIPKSEMTSGYHAKYAKDSTGFLPWKAGVVASKLKNNSRNVYLSRWLKPVRILSEAETALKYKEILGTEISVPFNVVPPALLTELEKVGVPIDYDGSPMYKSRQEKAKNDDIKLSARDSEGNTLTEAQQEFFKDSKVRDAKGNLLVMYHGTDADFTEFDRSKIGTNAGAAMGYGFYFTNKSAGDLDEASADVYGRNLLRGYVDIKNPLSVEKKTISKDAYLDIARRFREKVGIYGYPFTFSEIYDEAGSDYELYIGMTSRHSGENIDIGVVIDGFTALGFDGIIHPYGSAIHAVTFASNQFKSTQNTNPTSNPDIRYSLREYTDKQKENWKNSKYIILYENDKQFREFVKKASTDKQYKKKMYFGAIPTDLANLIKSKTGVSVENFNCSLSADEIRKIFKDHGNDKTEALRGQKGITEDDILNIPTVIESPEEIELSPNKYNGKPAIHFVKDINGKFTVVAVVSDNRLDLFVQTAYKGIKKGNLAMPTGEQAPINTPEANNGTVSNGIVRNSDKIVKQNSDNSIKESSRVSNTELAELDETALYIKNTKKANYIGMIFNGTKTEETRNQRTLDAFIGKDFYVTDGKYVYGTIVLGEPHKYTEAEFHKLENQRKHRVPKGDEYDVKKGGFKWAYPIESYTKFDKPKKLSDSSEYRNSFQAREVLFSERNPDSFSNRSLLANALENAATNDFEREKLAKYKEKISSINAEERKLADLHRQLKELRFSKGKRDAAKTKKIRDLQDEATKTANRISIYDKQLLNLEASKPLRDILEREKAKAAKRQKQRDAEILQEQKDKANATIREIMNRNTESRKRAVEGRHKTVVRNKIKRAIKDLNSVFNIGTKERNVKIGLRDTVRKALEASEVLFSDEITNEDIVRLGVDSVSAEEQAKLERYSELLLGIEAAKKKSAELAQSQDFKKDSMFAKDIAYKINENNKRIVSMKNQISKLNKELESVFIRERARLNKENVSSALDSLAEAYASLQNSDDDYIKNNAFVQGMHDRIKSLSENLNGVTIKDMSLEQLEEVYKMYSSVKHMIVNANSIFRDGLREDLSKKIMTVQGEILELQKDNRKDPRAVIDAINNAIKSFDWNNQKPVYAFEKLGSQAFQELFWDAVKAEGVYAQDVVEAGEFLDEQKDKFKYADWDFKKAKPFKSANGLDFKLTLSDMMSIYAYSKRPQAFDHMTQGGFTFDRGSVYADEKGRKRKHVRLSETYTVSIELINEIVKTLSEEQIGYVDAVQAYLTSLGEKGNEISRTLYGIDLFTEQVYFPLKSDADYRSSVEQALNETQTQVSLKNTGMTKQTVPHANNPIVLQGFDDVMLGHIDNMSKYHSFVLPIENLRRVFDNVSRDENASYDATKVIIESVFGESAKQYFDQYITDLNGGVHIGGYQNFMMDMFSKMKKTAVSASLSVVVQQPFAIVRAMDKINPVYFAPVNFEAAKKTDAKSQWEELKKYAPVAIIKEMGGFDVGSSRTTKDYIGGTNYKGWGKVKGFFKDSDYQKSSLDNIFMWGASKADELGWSTIWKAVKKEVASQHKELAIGSEEFLQKCGERFTEVIVYTQVYDSVNSRSGMMRSKRDLDKFATSFMGEPTTTINMVENRMLKLARAVKSKKGVAKASAAMGRTIGVTLGSILLTSLAKSLVYAGRDDDEEDKALLERWAKHFGDSLTNDLNPLTMIPYLRDFVSIWEGWDVERPDMTVVADVVTSIKKAIEEGCTVEEAIALIGNAGNAFGLPVKNIIREVQGAINVFNDITDDIEPTDISGAFKEGWSGKEKSTKDSLYQAIVSGDESRVSILKAEYKTEDSYEQAIRKGLRENDPRIREAAQARIDGDISEYSSIVREVKAEGHFSQDTIVAAVNAEINLINKESKEQNTGSNDEIEDTDEEKATSIYRASDINVAFENGDTNMALTIIEDLVETKVANGMTKKEAQSSVKSSITSYWKPLFLEAYTNKDSAEQKRIRQILLSSGLYGRTSEVIDTTQQWIKDSKNKTH